MSEREEQIKRLTDLLVIRMSQMHSYHDHKETMAHAAMLVTLALVGALLSATSWPPTWVPAFCKYPEEGCRLRWSRRHLVLHPHLHALAAPEPKGGGHLHCSSSESSSSLGDIPAY